MRVCVVGAGAIGGLVAGRLALAGQEVSVLARGATLEAIGTTGLTVVEPDGTARRAAMAHVAARAGDLGPHDLVVLAVKAHQLAGVAEEIPPLLDAASVVLTMQNGIPWWFFHGYGGTYEGHRLVSLDPDGVLERHIPAAQVLGAIAYPAAERDGPAVVRLVEGDRLPVGELDGSLSTRAAAIADALRGAGFTSKVVRDIRTHLWVKAYGNLAFNPMSALTGATLRELGTLPTSRELATRLMGEAATIAERLGLRIRVSAAQRIEGAASVGEHKTSMLQDAEAGRALEVEPLVGVFCELGRMTGTPTPAIDAVYQLTATLDARIRAGARRQDGDGRAGARGGDGVVGAVRAAR